VRIEPESKDEALEAGPWGLATLGRYAWAIPLALALLLYPLRGVTTTPDSAWYLTQALRMARGEQGAFVWAGGYVRPVLPFLISLPFRAFGPSVRAAFWVARAFYVLTVALAYFAGARLFDRWVGLAASLLALTSLTLNVWTGFVLIDGVLPFFVLLYVVLVYVAFERGGWPWFVAAGLALAVACATKEIALLFAPLSLLVWLVVRPYRTRRNLVKVIVGLGTFVVAWGVIMGLAIALFYGLDTLAVVGRTASAYAVSMSSLISRGGVPQASPDGAGAVRGLRRVLSAAGAYYQQFFARNFALAPLFPVAWTVMVARVAVKRDRATWVLTLAGLLHVPLVVLQSVDRFRIGQLLSLILLCYLALAQTALLAVRSLKGFAPPLRVAIGLAAVGSMLFLQVAVGVEGRSMLDLALDLEPDGAVKGDLGVYGYDFYSGAWHVGGFHRLQAEEVGRWIADHLPSQSRAMGEWYLLDGIYFHSGGDYQFLELFQYPPRPFQVHDAQLEDGERVTRIVYPPARDMGDGEPTVVSLWLPRGRVRNGALAHAVVEEHLLSQIREAGAEYLITTCANNALDRYLGAHPGFEEMARFDEVRVRVFEVVDPHPYQAFPTYVDLDLIALIEERWDTDTPTGHELRALFEEGLGWTEGEMWLALAQSSQRQHRVKESVSLFERAIAAAPSDLAAHWALGALYESRGMVAQAQETYRRGLSQGSDEALAERVAALEAVSPPRPANVQEATLGSELRLLGYDLATEAVRPGGTVEVVLYWEALDAMETSYTVFVHLVDAQGEYVNGWDNPPQGGTHPTNGWLTGEVVADAYRVSVPETVTPGACSIAVGAYDAQTMRRLTTADGAFEIVLDTGTQIVRE
jgi:4-amino-4-deoxy-L-arabinose transferase-like glycosyltransferase